MIVNRLLQAFVILGFALGVGRAAGQDPKGAPPQPAAEEKREKAEYEGVAFRSIVQDMAKRAGVSITFGKDVEPVKLDRNVWLVMFPETQEQAANLTCEEFGLILVVGDKGWRVAKPVLGKVDFEDVPAKQALEDLAKRAGVTVSFKDLDDKKLKETVTIESWQSVDLTLFARIICEDLDLQLAVREGSWTVSMGKTKSPIAKVIVSEESLKGRWFVSVDNIDVLTALSTIAKASDTVLGITDERITKDKSAPSEQKVKLHVDYATPDHLIRELCRQRYVLRVQFVPGDGKKPHRYEIRWWWR